LAGRTLQGLLDHRLASMGPPAELDEGGYRALVERLLGPSTKTATPAEGSEKLPTMSEEDLPFTSTQDEPTLENGGWS
jgi:hypothetical protein